MSIIACHVISQIGVAVIFVDTHCHLNYDTFQSTLPKIIERAIEVGVMRMVVPGTDLQSSLYAVELTKKYEQVYAAVGVHPTDFQHFERSQISTFEQLLKEPKVVAVGEIGLDLYHHPETLAEQELVFDSMLDLANDHNKPLILHSRNAVKEVLTVLQKRSICQPCANQDFLGVFHGFEGDETQAKEIIDSHMLIGIGGPITFRNAIEKQNLIRDIGVNHVVLETDAPFLSPHPFRGQTNEPARIPLIAKKLAELLNSTIEEIAIKTNRNSQLLFRWDDIL